MWKTVLRSILLILIILLPIMIWGVIIEPRLIDEVRLDVDIPNLPEAWEGRRVVFMADLQVGIFLDNSDTVKRMVERIIEGKPAVVLLGGDFIYHPTEDDDFEEALEEFEAEDRLEAQDVINEVVGILRPLAKAGLQVYAVLGNHDYAMETGSALKLSWVAEQLTSSLEEIDISVLQNQAVELTPDGGIADQNNALTLVGIGPYYPGEGNVDEALADVADEAPRLIMLHNPELFPRIPAGQAPLALAGHTHGGQIRIPFLKSWSWLSIVKEGEAHSDGWIHDYGQPGNRLYVNRGVGFSNVPIRLNCPPELTWVNLRRKSA